MVAKLTPQELEKIENEQELAVYRWFCRSYGRSYSFPRLTDKDEKDFIFGIKKCSPTLWEFFQRRQAADKLVYNFPKVVEYYDVQKFESICFELMKHFPGRNSTTGRDAMIYKSFNTYTELFIEASYLFTDQWERLDGFGGGSFEQLFSSVRLGLYSAVENCVLSRAGLNYPDLTNDPSPRLEAVKDYLKEVYFLRVRFQVFDALVRLNWLPKDVPGFVSQHQWDNFLGEVRARLMRKFGTNSPIVFRKIFGSETPPPPESQTQFNSYQEQILTWIAKIGVVSGNPDETPVNLEEVPTQDGFHRNYAQEQQERAERERQERERQERENPDWKNIHLDFNNNQNLVNEWINRGFLYQEVKGWIDVGLKPKQAGLAEYLKQKGWTPEKLLDEGDLEQLKKDYESSNIEPELEPDSPPSPPPPPEKDKNNNIDPKPEQEPKSSRASSPSRKAAEEGEDGSPPPKFTGFNSSELNDIVNKLNEGLAADSEKAGNNDSPVPSPGLGMPLTPNIMTSEEIKKMPWICMGMGLSEMPSWGYCDPSSVPFRHGSGDIITLLATLNSVSVRKDHSDILYNFFWAKNIDKKGFERLVKDDEPPNKERERESNY